MTGTFLTFFQTANSMNVYLIPRRWWFYSRFRDLPNKQDHCWGYWARPPQNLMMPEPRFSGTWQQSCPSNADVVDAGNTMGSGSPRMEIDFSQQSNWMINWSFAGDSINTNAYYILSCDCQGNDTFPKPSYFDPIPTGGSFVNAYVQYTATSGNSATGVPMVEIFSVNNPNGVPAYSPWPWPASSFYGSMPDGKVPNMLAQITFSPSEWPPGWNTYWVGTGKHPDQRNCISGNCGIPFRRQGKFLDGSGVIALRLIRARFGEKSIEFCAIRRRADWN